MKKRCDKHKAIVLAATSAMVCFSLTGCTNNIEKISTHIDNGQYQEALAVFSEWKMKDADREAFVAKMQETLTGVVDKYAEGTIDHSVVTSTINTIYEMQLSELDSDLVVAMADAEMLQISKEAYASGLRLFEQHSYIEAMRYFQNVSSRDCHYEDAVTKIDDSKRLYAESVIAEARKLADEELYPEALEALQQGSDNLPDHAGLKEQITQMQEEYDAYLLAQAKAEAMSQAEQLAKQNNYEDALAVLDNFSITYEVEDADVTARYDEYKATYIANICTKASQLREEQKYLHALQMLNNASAVVSAPEFDALIQQINEEKPTYLCEVKCQNSDRYEEITEGDPLMDTIGNQYPAGNLFEISTSDGGWSEDYKGYADYYLGYKYEKLYGTVAVDDNSDNTDCAFYIEGDGEILLKLELNRLTVPTPIEVDVSAVNVLTIRSGDIESDGRFYTILSDFLFDK